jgi:hypothetical protein
MPPVFATGDGSGVFGFLIVMAIVWYVTRPVDRWWQRNVVQPTAGPLLDFGKRQAGKILVNKLKGRL